MGSLRRKTFTRSLGAMQFMSIWILGPLLVTAGWDSRFTAWQAIQRGDSYYDQGDFDAAVVAYTEAIRLKSDYALAYRNRGAAYIEKGDMENASRRSGNNCCGSTVMANESEKDIGRLFRERKPIDEALNAAAREAVKRHRQQGQPLVACRNGQPVLISPEEVADDDTDQR